MPASNKERRQLEKAAAAKPKAAQIAPTPAYIADPQIASILVPEFFVDRGFLDPYSFRDTYNYYHREGTQRLLETAFKDKGDKAHRHAFDIILSLVNPFDGISFSAIRWKYKRRASKDTSNNKSRKKATDEPYTIVSYFDEQDRVTCNVIYDGDGNCRFQVDFAKHESGDVHWHSLIPGNLDHSSGEGHALPWQTCPWPWLCVCVTDVENISVPTLSPSDQELICHQITSRDPDDRKVFEKGLLNLRSSFSDSKGLMTWTIFSLILVTVIVLYVKLNREFNPEIDALARGLGLDLDDVTVDRFLSALVPPETQRATPS